MTNSRTIFVFGSNLSGIHGKGAAKFAVEKHGAKMFVSEGIQGNSYAIPTKDRGIKPLPLTEIEEHVSKFILFAKEHPELSFNITRIGCGLAGYRDEQIAPMFVGIPRNCCIPEEWRKYVRHWQEI